MNQEIIKIETKNIEIPKNWNYEKSVEKVKSFIYKWKNLTADIIQELWIAREKLSSQGLRDKSPEVKTWSDYCREIGSDRRVVNRWFQRYSESLLPKIENKFLPFPKGKFSIIYADPPWRYDFSKDSLDKIEEHYPTMSLEEIKLWKEEIKTEESAVLFLWATAPKLQEALEVMKTWGFEYKTHAIWDKDWIGMGYWFRGQHELLLVGTKGNVFPPEENLRVSSIYCERRIEHSKKPRFYYDLIEKMFPNQKYLEMFNRGGPYNEKWQVYGNE